MTPTTCSDAYEVLPNAPLCAAAGQFRPAHCTRTRARPAGRSAAGMGGAATGLRRQTSGHLLALALLVLALAACSHRGTRVERAMVLPANAEQHVVGPDQRFLMAVPIEDPDPVFPAGARGVEGTLLLCTTFVVDSEGAVTDVVADRADAMCADPADPAMTPFVDAVSDALGRWRYFAAAMCTFPGGADPEADPGCAGDGVRVDAVPIRLRYVFGFTVTGGRARVTRAPEPR